MNANQEHLYILFIVGVVGVFALVTIFSFAIKVAPGEAAAVDDDEGVDIIGAAVRTWQGTSTLCKSTYYDTPLRKGVTQVLRGSQFPDQCYDDKEVSEEPTNNGRYLREYYCDNNEVAYRVFDCGSSECQFGACINDYKYISE
jgi:hypothetical protein